MIDLVWYAGWFVAGIFLILYIMAMHDKKAIRRLYQITNSATGPTVDLIKAMQMNSDYWRDKYHDQVNNRHRARDPETGRFVSKGRKCLG